MVLRVVPRIVRGHATCELKFSAWAPGNVDSVAEFPIGLSAAKGILVGALISCAVWAGLVII